MKVPFSYVFRNLWTRKLTTLLTAGGMGLSAAEGAAIYGAYTAGVYMAAIPGGFVADRLLGLRKAAAGGQADPDLDLTQQLIAPQARRLSRYVCTHCGFKARQFYWQCPGCSRWDTYAPKRGEELEAGR